MVDFKYARLRIIVQISIAINMLLLAACGNGNNTPNDSTADTGELTFSVIYHSSNGDTRMQAAVIDCAGEGVSTVEASVYNSDGVFLVGGGPWACDAGYGTIKSIPAGGGRTIIILGKNINGDVIFRGEKSNVDVFAEAENDVGTIDCYAFVPSLRAPTDGSVVNASAMGLVWDAVPGAIGYHVIVSENSDLNAPLIDDATTYPNYSPTSLSNGSTYYWQVVAEDSHNHSGIVSSLWYFTVDEAHVNNPPEAKIISPSDSSTFTTDEAIQFTGSSVDAEDGHLTGASLVWESDISGPLGEGESFSRSLSEGEHLITLSAIDSEGATTQKTIIITINTGHVNSPPQVQITKPDHGKTFLISESIEFIGSSTDIEDGAVTGSSLVWRSDVDGWIGLDNTFTETLSAGTHRITLTATDSEGAVGSKNIAITIATGRLPDTGQTNSYTDSLGEDSDYRINPPSYTKLDATGNELDIDATNCVMVRDNVTGLIWEVKKIEDDAGWQFWRETFSYRDANKLLIDSINNEKLGGYSDWRLPSVKELVTIVDKGKKTIPLINKTYFPNTDYEVAFWTSNVHYTRTDVGWVVFFNIAQLSPPPLGMDSHFARAIRGKKKETDLRDNNDKTVIDVSTGLMWQQTEAGTMTWEGALAYCESLELAGYDDWRLPNYNELISIVDYSTHSPAIDKTFFKDFPDIETTIPIYWTSTTYPTHTDQAWCVSFLHGDVQTIFSIDSKGYNIDKSNSYFVRAVRGGW